MTVDLKIAVHIDVLTTLKCLSLLLYINNIM